MKEKNEIIQRNGKIICLCGIIFGVLNMIPLAFGAPGPSIAFMIITGIFPLLLGIFMISSFSGKEGDLKKLYTRAMHLSYICISLGISILLLMFAPITYISTAGVVFNMIAALGMVVSGLWILLNSYAVTRFSIIP
ncbi:MAG: hypothetical protein KAR18_00625 [Spirochaetes bacterium]|nr:hypothetical protein [Spirochaetota bacterium]